MKYLNALNKINGLGPQKMKMLLNFFNSPENIWQAGEKEIKASGIGETLTKKILTERKNINPDKEWEKIQKENIRLITLDDPFYPLLLKEIPNPPYLLYVKSELNNFNFNNQPAITIVGSRKFTAYGKQVAESLSRDLAKAGIIIVSGLALGIDSFAHQNALDAGGLTIAVLGSSLEDNLIGPRSNFNLSRHIMEAGILLSEYPPNTPANAGLFPARNRLMAGLSFGTLIIEAAEKSGSLITANFALEFNREVFAVPGPIFSPQSTGVNNLIKQGAKLVANVNDILEELHLERKKNLEVVKKTIPISTEEEKILKILSHEPFHIDKIAKIAKLEASIASSCLTIMEMKGKVKNIGGQNYILL